MRDGVSTEFFCSSSGRLGDCHGVWWALTTGSTTSQGSLMATRKDLKISTWGLSLSDFVSRCVEQGAFSNEAHTDHHPDPFLASHHHLVD